MRKIQWVLGLLALLLAAPSFGQTVLRTEFQDTQPKFIAQGGGAFGGLCLELMALLEKTSDLRFTYPGAFVPVARIADDLKNSQIDVYFGLGKTAQREKDFAFLGELFRTRYQFVARKGDPLASATLEQIRASGLPILVIRGTAQANYFEKVLGLPVEDAPSSVDIALRQLKAGNGRFFGYSDLGNAWQLNTPAYRDSLVAVPARLDEDAQWLCVSPTLPVAIAARLSAALEALKKTPEWASLIRKYFGPKESP